MYDRRTAALYDALYRGIGKDYAAEADAVLGVIRSAVPAARSVLDVACGTGGHLEHLRHHLEVEGVEGSEHMAQLARPRLPGVTVHVADMRSFDLGRRFDAVTCLFSSIGYLLAPEDLVQGIARMAAHVAPGGVLVVEPWFTPDQWRPDHVAAVSATEEGRAVARVSRSLRVGRRSVLDFHYTVATARGVDRFNQREELALHTEGEVAEAFGAAGLVADLDPVGITGRGLWLARCRP